MARLIDADALVSALNNGRLKEQTGRAVPFNAGVAFALTMVEYAPTIDPVRHGRWVPVTNGRGGYECDQCHNYAPSYQDGVEWLSDFCPNCGAYMRYEG